MKMLRFMTAGSVDDGKSTLIGRLFLDGGHVFDDQKESVTNNLAHLTDGLREERALGITIDVAYRYFESESTRFIVADSPGHREFTRNMVTAASQVDVLLILVDASLGVTEQTLRHLRVAQWMRVPNIVFVLNKIDLLQYKESQILELMESLKTLGPSAIIPVSGLEGENVIVRSDKMSFYTGPTLMSYLHSCATDRSNNDVTEIEVQLNLGTYVLGRLKGTVKEGDTLVNTRNSSIVRLSGLSLPASGAVSFESSDLLRGDILVRPDHPVSRSDQWKIEVFHLEGEDLCGLKLKLRTTTQEAGIKSFTVNSLQILETGKWSHQEIIKTEANFLYSGQMNLESEISLTDDATAILVDTSSCRTVAVMRLIP